MKYIKKMFNKENPPKFKEDDLVIPTIPLDDKLKKYVEKKYGKIKYAYKNGLCEIIYKDVTESIIDLMDKSRAGFHREYDVETGKSNVLVWLYEDQIRHLTPDELEKYRIKKDAEKFNL